MSRENVEVVRRVLDEFIATGQLSNEVAPDVIWDMSTFRGWPDQPVFHGFDGFGEFINAWKEPYDDWSMATDEALDAGGDRVVAVLAQRGRLRGSDAEVALRYGIVYTVRHGQVRGAQAYLTVEEALEAVGLSE